SSLDFYRVTKAMLCKSALIRIKNIKLKSSLFFCHSTYSETKKKTEDIKKGSDIFQSLPSMRILFQDEFS
ncbi:hypothetical protein, partial [Flammeovirga sp. SJP92]|uniref:hypothetical protein n=1 Tax=Flammeovirga sp. SJP92 TaxID=1775430 RepID=UPI001C12CEAA